MVQIQFFSGVHIKSKGGVLERLYCNHAVLPTKRAPKGEFARFSGMSIRHRRSFRGPNRPPVTDIVLKAGDNVEYASLRAVFTYGFSGQTCRALFVRWYAQSGHSNPTKCKMVRVPCNFI